MKNIKRQLVNYRNAMVPDRSCAGSTASGRSLCTV